MKFTVSKEVGYALQGLIHLARNENQKISTKTIAQEEKIPLPFLTKIFQSLHKNNLVILSRGKSGGAILARPARKITLLEIIEALEVSTSFCDCQKQFFGQGCQNKKCHLKPVWEKAEHALRKIFQKTKLSHLI